MDPDRARTVLTQAALVELQINMRAAPVHTLTAYDLVIMKQNNLKSNEAQVARKYHKIMDMLGELEGLVHKDSGRPRAGVQMPPPAAQMPVCSSSSRPSGAPY